MNTEHDTNLQSMMRDHLGYLVNTIGPRPIGSIQNIRASRHLTNYIETLGLKPSIHTASVIFRKPVKWSCSLHLGNVTEALSVLPGFATREIHHSQMPVMPYIYQTKEDFETYPPAPGTLVIVELGLLHEADACRLASPAAVVGWYRHKNQHLYSGNCMRDEEPSVPGFALSYPDVQRLLTPDALIDITIEVVNEPITIRNIIVDVGDVNYHPCFITHYDSRPLSPGANDNASGVVCLLGLLSQWPKDRPARFIFFDAEEVGTVGARLYVEYLQTERKLGEISCTINPDSVGLGELHLYTADHTGPLSERLLACAQHAFHSSGWDIPERAARSGVSDYIRFRRAGVPCLFLSDYPNDVRHTTDDTLEHIQDGTLVRLTKVLSDEAFYLSVLHHGTSRKTG